jgi:predicted nucleic acid-binding protein
VAKTEVSDVLVDSNVLIDYLSEENEWFDWSVRMLEGVAERGRVYVNPIVYSEVSVAYDAIEDVEAALPAEYLLRTPLPWEASFVAAKVFQLYRKRGGKRTSCLPDFFIGAHAAVSGLTLLTRDARRYRTYFPKLKVIAP